MILRSHTTHTFYIGQSGYLSSVVVIFWVFLKVSGFPYTQCTSALVRYVQRNLNSAICYTLDGDLSCVLPIFVKDHFSSMTGVGTVKLAERSWGVDRAWPPTGDLSRFAPFLKSRDS